MLFVAGNQQVDVSARTRITTAGRQTAGDNFPTFVDVACLVQRSTRFFRNQSVEIATDALVKYSFVFSVGADASPDYGVGCFVGEEYKCSE